MGELGDTGVRSGIELRMTPFTVTNTFRDPARFRCSQSHTPCQVPRLIRPSVTGTVRLEPRKQALTWAGCKADESSRSVLPLMNWSLVEVKHSRPNFFVSCWHIFISTFRFAVAAICVCLNCYCQTPNRPIFLGKTKGEKSPWCPLAETKVAESQVRILNKLMEGLFS